MLKKFKDLNKLGLFAQVLLEQVSKTPQITKVRAESKDNDNYMAICEKKDSVGLEVIALKENISILEDRYKNLIKEDKTVSISLNGTDLSLPIDYFLNQIKDELEAEKEKHAKLSKEFFNLCNEVDSFGRGSSSKGEKKTTSKEREEVDKLNHLKQLLPKLMEAADLISEGQPNKDGLFRLHKKNNKMECSYDKIVIFTDLITHENRVGSKSILNHVELLADGESTDINQLNWHVKFNDDYSKNLEHMYKKLALFVREIEENDEQEINPKNTRWLLETN